MLDQLPKLLGVHIEGPGSCATSPRSPRIPDGSGLTFGLAVFLLALIFLLERYTPWLPVLVAIGLAIAASTAFRIARGRRSRSRGGATAEDLPSLVLPDLDLALQMWPAAAGIALMSFTETIAVGRAFAAPEAAAVARSRADRDRRRERRRRPARGDAGRQRCLADRGEPPRQAQGLEVADLVTAATALATLVLLAPLIGLMPHDGARRGGGGVFDPEGFQAGRVRRDPQRVRRHRVLLGADRLRRVLLGTLNGILVAVVASLLMTAQQAYSPPVHVIGRKRGTDVYRPRSEEHPDDEELAGIAHHAPRRNALFFANAPVIAEKPHRVRARGRKSCCSTSARCSTSSTPRSRC